MRRAAALAAALLLPAAARSAPLGMEAALEADGVLSVKASAPGHPGGVLDLRVLREAPLPSLRGSELLRVLRLRLGPDGRAEARFPLGGLVAAPGRYRLSASGEGLLAEAVLADALATRPFLEALLSAQAGLEEALAGARAFRDRLDGLEAAASLEAWTAWRKEALPALERRILALRAGRDGLYPESRLALAEGLLQAGLHQRESLAYQALKCGRAAVGLREAALDPAACERILLKESWTFRLGILNALFEAAEGGRLGRARWEALLALWERPLPRVSAEAARGLPGDGELGELAAAFRSWMDAAAGEADGRRQALKDLFRSRLLQLAAGTP